MLHSPTMRGGWYETIRPDAFGGVSRHTVYLVHVPEVGPFITDEDGTFHGLPDQARDWEWHGPFPTARVARGAELRWDLAARDTFDGD